MKNIFLYWHQTHYGCSPEHFESNFWEYDLGDIQEAFEAGYRLGKKEATQPKITPTLNPNQRKN